MGRKYKQIETDTYYQAVDNMSMKDVIREYQKLAKRANQRIVELRKHNVGIPQADAFYMLAQQKGVSVEEYRKMVAQGKTEKSGLPKLRFKEKLTKYSEELTIEKGEKKALTQLKNELLRTYRFLQAETTTMRGRKEQQRKIKEGLAKRKLGVEGKTEEEKKLIQKEVSKLSVKGLDIFLSNINVLKDMLSYDYEDVLDEYYEANDRKPLTPDETKRFIEIALHSRNIDQFRKTYKNTSTVSYKDFVSELKKAGKEHYLNINTGKELLSHKRERLKKKFKK